MSVALPQGFHESAQLLRHLRGRDASDMRRELCAAFDLSPSTLSRYLHSIGIRDRVRTGDPEVRSGEVTSEELRAVWAIQWSSYTQDKGLIMPDEVAMEIAVANSKLRPDVMTVDTYRSWKRAQGVNQTNYADAEAHTQLRSLGPNHVWQIDFSLARNWKVKNNKLHFDEVAYKGKDLAINELRIIRFVVIDHYSGAIFVRYFMGRGESTPIFLEGLYHAMADKALNDGTPINDKYPFAGVPQILMVDRGSFSKANVTQQVVERLGVQLIVAHGARAKGSVESTMWLWERHFESSFRIDPFHSVEELNDEALHRAALINAERVHTRHGRSRRALWLQKINSNDQSQLRKLTCDLSAYKAIALSEPERRRVSGDLTISYKGQIYRLPDQMRYQKQVELIFSVFDYPRLQVRKCDEVDAERFFVEPIQVDDAGFRTDSPIIGQEFKSHKKSNKQTAVEVAQQVVNGFAPGEIIARGRDLEQIKATALKPRIEEVEITPATAATIRRADARLKVREAIQRDFTQPERDYFAAWPEEVTEEQIETAIEAFEKGLTAKVLNFGRAI